MSCAILVLGFLAIIEIGILFVPRYYDTVRLQESGVTTIATVIDKDTHSSLGPDVSFSSYKITYQFTATLPYSSVKAPRLPVSRALRGRATRCIRGDEMPIKYL